MDFCVCRRAIGIESDCDVESVRLPPPTSPSILMTQKSVSTSSSSTSRKKRHQAAVAEDEPWTTMAFPTNFNAIVGTRPPLAPPGLMRLLGGQPTTPVRQNTGKVKAMLRVCPVDGSRSSFLVCDEQKKQVTILDQSVCAHHSVTTPAAVSSPSAASSRRRPLAPKTFVFDSVFSQDSSMSEICSTSLVDIIQSVAGGQDGCVFSYGHARLGKTYTMLGVDDSPQNLGVIPCAIAWLYRLIDDRKQSTATTRFSVRVSAVEVTGRQETLTDLLAGHATTTTADSAGNSTHGVFLRDDPVSGIQLENQSELRAPTARHAAFYLDAAIAARTISEVDDDARNSHLLFTLNVYQYRVDHDNSGQDEVVGGRSRLHLLDLGSCSRGKNASGSNVSALSLSSLGGVLLALLNGQRHVPHRDSKLTQLLWDTLSGSSSSSSATNCCIIAHVSPADHAYIETLQVVQLASRIFRIRVRKKNKPYGTSSDDSSQDGSVVPAPLMSARSPRRLTPQQIAAARRLNAVTGSSGSRSSGLSSSDVDYTSSSEQSCDTVIYVGKNGRMLSDRELTDNEGPPPASTTTTTTTPRAPANKCSGLTTYRPAPSSAINDVDRTHDLTQTDRCKEGSPSTSPTNTNSPSRSTSTKQFQKALPNGLSTTSVELSAQKLIQQKAAVADETRSHNASNGRDAVAVVPLVSSTSEIAAIVAPSSGKIRRKVRRPPLPTSEGGVDGEQWIDGPNAESFVPTQLKTCTVPVGDVTGGATAPSGPAVVDARRENDEKWIDGPPEFRADSLSVPGGGQGLQARILNSRMPKCPGKTSTSNRRKLSNECGQDVDNDIIIGDVAILTSRPTAVNDQTIDSQMTSVNAFVDIRSAVTTPKTRAERCPDLRASGQNGDLDIAGGMSSPGTPSHKRRGHHHHHHYQSSKKGPVNLNGNANEADSPSVNGMIVGMQSTSPARSRHAISNQHSIVQAMHIPSSSPRHSGAASGGRVAQWVRSVQAATAAAFSSSSTAATGAYHDPMPAVGPIPLPNVDPRHQTWSSSPSRRSRNSPFRLRSAERAFRDPFGFLMDSFDSESDATASVGNDSPPPDYASCVAADRHFSSSAAQLLDINENEAHGNGRGVNLGTSTEHAKHSGLVGTFDWSSGSDARRLLQRTSGVWTYVPSPLLIASPGNFPCSFSTGEHRNRQADPSADSVPEVYDVSTWPRRHQATIDDNDPTECKRLHHPDGASDPKLSVVEVARPSELDSLKVLSSLVSPPQIASISTCLQSFVTPPYLRNGLDAHAPPSKQEPIYAVPKKPVIGVVTSADESKLLVELTRSDDNERRRMETAEHITTNDVVVEPSPLIDSDRHSSTHPSPAVLIGHALHLSDAQSLASSRSPSSSGSGSDTKTRSSSSSTSSAKAVERCKSSSGVSLLSCISPRRRARPFAGLFSRSHGAKELSVEPPLNPSIGFDVALTSGWCELGATSSGDDSCCEPGTGRCLQDSDRGSSLSDCAGPPPGELAQRLPGGGDMETSSDYGSGQVDGEPNLLTVGLIAGLDEESNEAIKTECVGELVDHVHVDMVRPVLPGQPKSRDIRARQPTVSSSSVTTADDASLSNDGKDDNALTSRLPPSSVENRRQRIYELLARQRKLKTDLASAKTTLMVDPDSWSYDLHVAEQLDRDDPGYIEALERETAILEKRVVACKSRIMIVTVFDVTNT